MKIFVKKFYLNFRKYILNWFSIFLSRKIISSIGSNDETKKILFIRIDRIGDLILSTPTLKALKQNFPNSELTLLASKSNHSVVLHNPYIDNVIVYDHNQSILEKIATIIHLTEYNFDLAVDPYTDFELKTALIAALSSAENRLGYASYGREFFFNITAPEIESNQHFIEATLNVLKPLGIENRNRTPEIFLSEPEKKWSKNWILKNKIGGRPIVGIHPGAHYESQRWLPDYYAELVNKANQGNKFDFLLFGGAEDRDLIDNIKSLIFDKVLTFLGEDLRQFISLVDSCDILICNNSGPLHLAVALSTPSISFMGPTDKNHWMPAGSQHHVLRVDSLPCIGCNQGRCTRKTHDCMRLISPSMVIETLNEMLQI